MATFATSTAAVMGSARPGRVAGPRRCVAARASSTIAAVAVGRTHYEVLGVGSGASRGEIKAAYRRLAREVHPDAAVGGGDEGFIRLHAAYATLADPDERALRPGRGLPRRGDDDAAGGCGRAGIPAEDVGDRPVLVGRTAWQTRLPSGTPTGGRLVCSGTALRWSFRLPCNVRSDWTVQIG